MGRVHGNHAGAFLASNCKIVHGAAETRFGIPATYMTEDHTTILVTHEVLIYDLHITCVFIFYYI